MAFTVNSLQPWYELRNPWLHCVTICVRVAGFKRVFIASVLASYYFLNLIFSNSVFSPALLFVVFVGLVSFV